MALTEKQIKANNYDKITTYYILKVTMNVYRQEEQFKNWFTPLSKMNTIASIYKLLVHKLHQQRTIH